MLVGGMLMLMVLAQKAAENKGEHANIRLLPRGE